MFLCEYPFDSPLMETKTNVQVTLAYGSRSRDERRNDVISGLLKVVPAKIPWPCGRKQCGQNVKMRPKGDRVVAVVVVVFFFFFFFSWFASLKACYGVGVFFVCFE